MSGNAKQASRPMVPGLVCGKNELWGAVKVELAFSRITCPITVGVD